MKPKLVRDHIPDLIMQNEKEIPQVYKANDKEYWLKLKEKLIEEANEFIASEEVIELADLIEVIDAIVTFKNTSLEKIIELKKRKALSHGTFSKRFILKSNDKD